MGLSVDHCVARCALLKHRTCARVCWRIVFFFSFFLYFFRMRSFSTFFSHFRVFTDLLAEEGQRDAKFRRAPSTIIGTSVFWHYSTSFEAACLTTGSVIPAPMAVNLSSCGSLSRDNAQGWGRDTKNPTLAFECQSIAVFLQWW